MLDRLVQSHHHLQLHDRVLEAVLLPQDLRNVEPGPRLPGPVPDLLSDGQRLLVVRQRRVQVPAVVVDSADVVQGGALGRTMRRLQVLSA